MVEVLLINPRNPLAVCHIPTFPLGLGYIAAALEAEGIDVRVIDQDAENIGNEKLIKKIESINPQVVAFSSTTISLPNVIQVARSIKKLKIPICIGGPHATSDPTFIYRFRHLFDYQIIGEGEITFPHIVKKILKNKRINKKIIFGKPILNLNTLPFPAYHLFPMKKYKFAGNIIFSRGCPYNCIFCPNPLKKLRFRNIRNVVEELNILKKYYRRVSFRDDNFTIDKKYTERLCKEIVKERLDLEWICQTRCDLVNYKILQIMKRSGCSTIGFGVETFSERLQKKIKKNLNLKTIIRSISLVKKANLKVVINCLFGIPWETEKDLWSIPYYLNKLKPDFFLLFLLTPFPKTEIFRICIRKGFLRKDVWDKYALGLIPPPYCVSNKIHPLFYILWLINFHKIFKLPISNWMAIGFIIRLFSNKLPFSFVKKIYPLIERRLEIENISTGLKILKEEKA